MLSRRSFVTAAAASAASAALLRTASAESLPAGWRRFEVTTRLDLSGQPGPAQAWVPLASVSDPDWVRVESNEWTVSPDGKAERHVAPGADLLHLSWGEGARTAEVRSVVVTRDRDATRASGAAAVLSEGERATWLRGSALAPTDGIVKETADRIVAGATDDRAKALALYQWVVEHTFREGPVPGCGDGNVLRMLQTGHLGGKCADINPLFVALARAAGLPARDLYGIRVAPSRLRYASLGPSTATITKAQHCRAEVFLPGSGWTAMDPADVRKVMLEEVPGGLGFDAPKVAAARGRLFGAWEGNWIPFNTANDLVLPGRTGASLPFLMYPQVETASGIVDCYHPDAVRYSVTARELSI